jgi:hypothetical protein
MEPNKSLDDSYKLIAALLCDVHSSHGCVFNTRALALTLKKIRSRLFAEGIGFLTKTLPRLGKALDKALSGQDRLNSIVLGFDTQDGDTELPRFLGEFFNRVLQPSGALLEHPCVTSVGVLRQVLYLFYKYELPYTDEQEQNVISKFERTEDELSSTDSVLQRIAEQSRLRSVFRREPAQQVLSTPRVARRARSLLWSLFRSFDPKNIHPRHGPGAVATRQKHSEKYLWTNVSAKITDVYPFDAYFCASLGHVCDRYQQFHTVDDKDQSARVILVPKDSRGPRLISCEPVDYQWVQQGLGRAIVDLVERHHLTKWNVRFTDQAPNRVAALYGSSSGKYATLDLNEASDRVSLELVRLLFPEHILVYLEACRTSSTELPDGRVLPLRKFAPMGSALCFPIMALCVWAILTAAANDADTRESIYVYGDDVIVPTAFAVNAIEQLEAFGLRVNRDKSCTSGLFRESCGMDAFNGVDVTPVRLRTVWSSTPRPEAYSSWIAYANSFWDKRYYRTYEFIRERLHSLYGPIPSDDMHLACPSLREVPEDERPKRRRFNRDLQKVQYKVRDLKSPAHTEIIDGWSMLLRYFAEAGTDCPFDDAAKHQKHKERLSVERRAFSVSRYTNRRASLLVRRWR